MASKPPSTSLAILHLEDDTSIARKVKQILIDNGFDISIEPVRTFKDFQEQLEQHSFQLIFLDDHVSDGNGLQALDMITQKQLPVSVVMFSDILDEVAIVDYMRRGAVDYVLKTNLERLPEVVQRIVTENQKQNAFIDFQKFFETSADLLCSCDRQGHFINLNHTWKKVLGFPVEELEGKSFLEFVYAEDREATQTRFESLFDANHNNGELTACFVAQNGDVRWLQWYTAAQTGGVVYAIARDITELKQNEIKLTHEQENLKQQIEQYKVEVTQKSIVADQIHDSVITTDLKGSITSWNHGSERVFGYSAQEAIGQHIALVYPEKDYKFIQNQAANILLEQGSQDFDIHMRRKSGEVFDAKLSLSVTRDHSGEVNGMVGYAVDLGPAMTAPQNTFGLEQRLETIIATSPVVTFACDWQDDYALRYVSSNIEILFGFPAERCVSEEQFLLSQCHPDDREQLRMALKNIAETESFSQAYRFKKADGEYCWVHNELKLLKDNEQKPMEVVGMLVDLEQLHHVQQVLKELEQAVQEKELQLKEAQTRSQQWEQQLQNAEQQLQQLDQELQTAMQSLEQRQQEEKAVQEHSSDAELHAALMQAEKATHEKAEFISSISHELRVTLNAVLGFAQIMALDEGLNDNNRQYLQEISDAGSRLLDVVGRILNLVSLDTGDASLANETFNLSLLVEEVVGHSAGAANAKGVMLDFPHENIDTAYEICGDQQCLKQVLSYVFSDAVKNAASGSRLVVGFEKQRGDIRIEIKTAIPGNENGQPVTTPQAADFSRQDQGGANNTRIELLITQTLLELMGGTMRYEFNPDKVVAITIPAQIQAMDEVEDELSEDSSHEHSTAEEKVILYIEDDDASIRLVETLLRQRPYCRLLATRDPAQCAALVERHQPALILLDANIPGSDGYKLLEQWRDEPALQQIPVIVVTTDAMPDEVNKASKAGAVELLAKPIEINRFLTVIDSFVTTQHTEALKKIKTS